MALINCPECGKQISEKAAVCPHCGIGVQKALEEIREKERQKREEQRQKQKKLLRRILITMASLCVVAAIAIVGYLYSIDALNTIPTDYRKLTESYLTSCETAITEGNFDKGARSLNALKIRTLTKRQAKRLEETEHTMAELGLNELDNTIASMVYNSDMRVDEKAVKHAKEQMVILSAYQLDSAQTKRLNEARGKFVESLLAVMEKRVELHEGDARGTSSFYITEQIALNLQDMELSNTQKKRFEEALQNIDNIKQQKEENRQKQLQIRIRDEYLRLLSDNKADNSDFGYSDTGYFLFDLDDNGIPELWIKSGTCEADYRILVYTYGNGSRKVYDESAGHTSFYKGDGYVLKVYGYMGMTNWDKLTYNGFTITETTIYAGDSTYEGDDDVEEDAIEPEEQLIKLYSLTNKQPVMNAFKTD